MAKEYCFPRKGTNQLFDFGEALTVKPTILWFCLCNQRVFTTFQAGFRATERDWNMLAKEQQNISGSTVCSCVIHGRKLYVAHVGDSRAVLSRGGKAIDLTKDHTPSE